MTTADKEYVKETVASLVDEEIAQHLDMKTAIYQRDRVGVLQRLEKKSPALLVLRGAETGLRISIRSERVTIGRTVDSDIVLADKLISRQHAEIVWDEESDLFRVVDLNSTNGTFVNDRLITTCELHDGDKVFIGSTILKFVLQDEVDHQSSQLFDKLMFQDDLTGLVVRRRFDSDLRVHLQSAGVLGRPVSLLMMDMDGLKKVNDTHGHQAGAFVISEVGKMLGRVCQEHGDACRYGGDEFIAYLLECDKAAGTAIAQRICELVRGEVFRKDGLELRVSISIGIAAYPADASEIEALTREADEALYRAKANGRDTVSD